MRVTTAFGKGGREIELPDRNVAAVLNMPEATPVLDALSAVAAGLRNPIESPPLAEVARGKRDAVIVVCDITRPAPNRVMLPPIIETLEGAGIPRERITILVATGLHRPSTPAEQEAMLGEPIAHGHRVVNHRAVEADEQIHLGTTTNGVEVDIDRVYAEASLKITTGFIEPHLVAGFSGGRKLCGIGCGGERTIRGLHAPRIIEHPNSVEGRIDGNILHEELTDIAAMAGMDFIVNVTMDEAHRITGIFAGHFDQAFRAGCDFARRAVGCTVEREVDIVITSGAGYPQDLSYYHTGKAFTGARHICKPGGTIIVLSECSEGLGKPGYADLCRRFPTVEAFLDDVMSADANAWRYARHIDQWQIQNVTRALRKCHCILVDDGLTPDERGLLLHPAVASFEEAFRTVLDRHGPDASIAVIPKGPNVLASIA